MLDSAPRISCTPSETVAFDATQHVRTELYRGHGLVAETIRGTFSDEHLRLDELYMSHGKLSNTFPSQIANRLQGTGAGRTTLDLDPELLARCPLFTSIAQQNIECATTKDGDLQGQHARVGSSVYYVHQVFGTDDTQADDSSIDM